MTDQPISGGRDGAPHRRDRQEGQIMNATTTVIPRATAVRRITQPLADRTAFIIIAPPTLIAELAERLCGIPTGWTAYIDCGAPTVITTGQPGALAVPAVVTCQRCHDLTAAEPVDGRCQSCHRHTTNAPRRTLHLTAAGPPRQLDEHTMVCFPPTVLVVWLCPRCRR